MIPIAFCVFWISVLLLLHVFVGYPVSVWLGARWFPRPVHKHAATPTVTVVMAAHAGAAYIQARLTNLAALDYPGECIECIVACDGCIDDTAALCRQFADPRVRVLEFPERRGKAACLNDAVAVASGEILLMLDVRQRLAPSALSELVANLADASVGAVSGELLFEDADTGFARGVDAYWRYEKLIRHAESRSGSTVGVTGALYAIRRVLFRPLPAGTVLDDVLVPMRVAAAGKRVVFEPLAQAWDRPSQQPAQERQRKVRTLAGNYQLLQLAPWLMSPWQNPLWYRFVSHKLLRLLAPWLLLTLTLSAVVLAPHSGMYVLALILVLAALALVLLGRLLPSSAALLPVRLATAFFYLNVFAALALVAFVRNRRLHLW